MNNFEAANLASQVVKHAAAAAKAVGATESLISVAITAAEQVVSALAAESNDTEELITLYSKTTLVSSLFVAKEAAAKTLLAAKEETDTTLAMARELAKSMNQELVVRQQALNSISQGLLITDAKRNTTFLNDAFERITGYTKADLMGVSCAILQGSGTNPETVRELRTALNAGQSFHGEILNYRKDGTTFWNELSVNPVRDGEGELIQFVGVQRVISDRKSAAEKIEHLAFYDHLTDLPNRRLLMDRLNHAFTSSQRSGLEGAVLLFDLDNFKDINDTFGHDIGDVLIQQTARRLASCVREGDTVARLGGDEFAVVLEALSAQHIEAAKQVDAIAKKILAVLNKPYQLDTHDCSMTCSIGAVLFSDHHHSAVELLKRADIAMFRSKKAGRNTLTFFNYEMQKILYERAAIEREMYTALQSGQFVLNYQIQVDSEHRPLGAEALIRWLHPERGLVSPALFLPLAEEANLMLPIGQWVLKTACSQLKAWEQSVLTRDLVLSVNVSAKEFQHAEFSSQIKALLQTHAINPRLLKLELTEGMLLESIEDIITLMNSLKEIGVSFSLDDFGTGYSSPQYLKRLPIDQLKIDQSFVRDIVSDSSDRAIVHTIVAMAQSLGKRVIAEGVETEEQRQLLLDNGCTQYQGYLFGKPMPIAQFDELLKKASNNPPPNQVSAI